MFVACTSFVLVFSISLSLSLSLSLLNCLRPGGGKRQRTAADFAAGSERHLPASFAISDEQQQQIQNLQQLPGQCAPLLELHSKMLFHRAALWQNKPRAMLVADASCSKWASHQIYCSELPPLKPRSTLLALSESEKLRLLTCQETLAAKGYQLGSVKLQLLTLPAAQAACFSAPPVPLAVVCLAIAMQI